MALPNTGIAVVYIVVSYVMLRQHKDANSILPITPDFTTVVVHFFFRRTVMCYTINL